MDHVIFLSFFLSWPWRYPRAAGYISTSSLTILNTQSCSLCFSAGSQIKMANSLMQVQAKATSSATSTRGMLANNIIAAMMIMLWMLVVAASADQQQQMVRLKHQPRRRDGSLTFLVVGDWGRKGTYNQSRVAVQMGKVGQAMDIDFVVSTGDNFYTDGLMGEHDPAFTESFTRIYTAKSLQTQWYSVLGNHDYRGNVRAQLSPFLRKLDTRWLCLRSFVLSAGIADIFFLDTTPFVQSYYTDLDHTYDWRDIGSPKDYTRNILTSLDSDLKKSSATWKIVVGHHAIKSAGYHGDTTELLQNLLPILKANKVVFYVNGHDHCLQHIGDTKSDIQFFTSGAGSKAWRGDTRHLKRSDLKFFYDGQGFMAVQLGREKLEILFYDINGKVLHRWSSLKKLHFPMQTSSSSFWFIITRLMEYF